MLSWCGSNIYGSMQCVFFVRVTNVLFRGAPKHGLPSLQSCFLPQHRPQGFLSIDCRAYAVNSCQWSAYLLTRHVFPTATSNQGGGTSVGPGDGENALPSASSGRHLRSADNGATGSQPDTHPVPSGAGSSPQPQNSVGAELQNAQSQSAPTGAGSSPQPQNSIGAALAQAPPHASGTSP